jgi:hypothetical protein
MVLLTLGVSGMILGQDVRDVSIVSIALGILGERVLLSTP